MRVGMLHPDGTPQLAIVDQGHDVLGGDQRLFLYGGIVPGGDGGATLIAALEGPGGGGSPGSAIVYELPLRWVERSG
jgi:hypothetical protein